MRRQSLRTIPLKIVEKTFEHLDDSNWRYSIASQLLLKTFAAQLSSNEIRISFDDEKFNIKKQLITQSKMLTKGVKEKGLVLEIPRNTKEEDFIGKLQNVPGVRTLNSEYRCYIMVNIFCLS